MFFKCYFGPAKCGLSPLPVAVSACLCVFRERRGIAGERPPGLSGPCGSYSNGTFYVFAGCDHRQYTNEVRFTPLSLPWGKLDDASCPCRCSAVSSRSRNTGGRERLTPTEPRRRPGSITPAGCTETGEAPNMSQIIDPFVEMHD